MFKLTVRRRIIALMLVVLLVPLGVANLIWLWSSQSELRDAAAGRQKLLVQSSAEAVDAFLNSKVDEAIIHSQTAGVQNLALPDAEKDLTNYLKQDPDLSAIALVDAQGLQRLMVIGAGVSTTVVNVSSDPAFRVVTFLGGEDYIGPVTFDPSHNGYVTIAVPLLNYATTTPGSYMSTSQPGVVLAQSQIKGALIVKVALASLWKSVLADRLGQSGYAYIVDRQGNLVAYPHAAFANNHTNVSSVAEVKAALQQSQGPTTTPADPAPKETVSETGALVLSSHYPVTRTGWVVVAEEPVSSVYAAANQAVAVAAAFFVLSALVGLVLILVTARSLLRPIKVLTQGAQQLAKGDLGARIGLNSGDEFGQLAETFNAMADKISADMSKLKDIDSLKNEFIAIASHNLRTPVSLIRGYVELLRELPVPAEAKTMLSKIEMGVQELAVFSADMVTISSIEAGGSAVEIKPLSVTELLEPIRKTVTAGAKKKGVELIWNVPDPNAAVKLAAGHVRSAVSNLLANAIEFTPRDGEVELKVEVNPQACVITVRDTGSGIDPEEMDKLFTMFHRGTGILRYDHTGKGIGLYLTRLVVDAHHGQIKVRSRWGRGTEFIITLPSS